jgi:hypothetical protein
LLKWTPALRHSRVVIAQPSVRCCRASRRCIRRLR